MSLASLAIAAGSMAALAMPLSASAQTCPYNSTQGTCACPTSGSGTTCFGGQLYRSTDSTCQNDTRPCAANQNFNCSTASCSCNTAAFPCGGCTAASSTVGASCGTPAGGQYTNICGACACPSGTTLCGTSNTCVTTLSCPAGTTFDPCTNSCNTPNVLVSPGFTQNGFINIAGDINERGGNLRLDFSTGGGQGDFYMANGKALRVDGAGVTSLSIGNWGAGGTGVNVFQTGNTFLTGLSTIASDNAVAAGTIESSSICFGNAVNCRTSWPSTTDFNPSYVNVTGDTMTGDLNLTGASTDLFVAGNLGIGTTTPVDGRLEIVRASNSYRGNLVFGTGTNNDWEIGELNTDGSFTFKRVTTQPIIGSAVMTFDTLDQVGIGTATPGATLDVFGTTKTIGLQITGGTPGAGRVLKSDASGIGTWQSDTSIGGSGTTNRVAKFTGAVTIGDSTITDNGTSVGVNTTAPTGRLQVGSDTYDFPGAQQRRFTTSLTGAQMFMNDSSGSSIMAIGTGPSSDDSLGFNMNGAVPMIITSGGNIGMGTTTPTQRLDVSGNAKIAGTAALGGYSLDVDNNGQGGGIDVTTNSTLNGIPALRVSNIGQGRGIEVSGGSAAVAAQINANAGNMALEAAAYNYPGANTIGTIMQIRRGVGSGTAPQVGMGSILGFPLQSDAAGSYGGGGGVGAVVSSVSPWKTDLFFQTNSGFSNTEKMRVTADGNVGIGTTTPTTQLEVASSGDGFRVGNASSWFKFWVGGNSRMSLGDGAGHEAGFIAGGHNGSGQNTITVTGCADGGSCPAYTTFVENGRVGIGTQTPSEMLEVNGNLKFTGANPYISAASYFVAPGGAYFNSGTVYTEAAIQARGGIHNDSGSSLVLQGGTSGNTSTSGTLTVNAGGGASQAGVAINGSSGTWGPSVGVNNGSQEWRAVSWSDNTYKVVKVTGSTFTPFTIYNNAYQDELVLMSNGISLSGKHAFRSDDSWLRLNQDGAFTSGVHTPGNFAPGALNVGGANGWGNPGFGNSWILGTETIYGDISAENNSWGGGSGWVYCPTNGQCWCPGGEFTIAVLNYFYYYGYGYIYCAKP